MLTLMFQGTGSNVGKSMLVAGLCRRLRQLGYRVAPFKPQNMSNNAAVAWEGGEIGRAQALQALACGLEPSIHMNPVLLKPQTNIGSQVVVQGKAVGHLRASEYSKGKQQLLEAVMQSFQHLQQSADIVVVEGAGSASEVNLRKGDIANMGFAQAANVPVILVGDIDRGGVIASIVGTEKLLAPQDLAMVKGFMINKFRGDVSLFQKGIEILTEQTCWPSFGILPWFDAAALLPAEDSEDLERAQTVSDDREMFKIAVPVLPRIANFDDLDALKSEPNVSLKMLRRGETLSPDTDLVIIPGSKSTIGDLDAMKAEGWDIDIKAHARRGGSVLGLCGGYQMLGKCVHDPEGVETAAGTISNGLGLLDIETVMVREKHTSQVVGTHIDSGAHISGYEIHAGRSYGPDCCRPLFHIDGKEEGARSRNGRIMGSYVHGLFNQDGFRAAFLGLIGGQASKHSYTQQVDDTLDALAKHISQHLDVEGLIDVAKAGIEPSRPMPTNTD